jgi:predicted DNA-binding transcriptional regulator AlpA
LVFLGLAQFKQSEDIMKLIRERQRRELTGVSRASWWRFERDGYAPKRFHLSPGIAVWDEEEIVAWLEARKAERDATPEVA